MPAKPRRIIIEQHLGETDFKVRTLDMYEATETGASEKIIGIRSGLDDYLAKLIDDLEKQNKDHQVVIEELEKVIGNERLGMSVRNAAREELKTLRDREKAAIA